MTAETSPSLPLRERKKLRTRQVLIDTALDLFGAHGFDGVTLDALCEAAEVSKRTFFRYFAGKEDVAMAPTQDLWAVFLDVLETCPADGRRLLPVRGRPRRGRRPDAGRRLGRARPHQPSPRRPYALHGRARPRLLRPHHPVRARRGRAALRPPGPDGPLHARLALDLLVVLFHRALDAWVAQPSGHTPEDLVHRLRATAPNCPRRSP
ncbi:helix-turn-helix domain containing protein [Streptomyces diastatochromogenes]|nr:helix-turn-helix domain containing protein [Streptomyces diastatochromogenes]